MKFDHDHHEPDSELFQIAAMVDVVFILLAFFVLSVRFHSSERDLAMTHHDAGPPSAVAQDMPSQIVVRVERDASGGVHMSLGSAVMPMNGYGALTARLTQINLPEMPVVLAADPELSVDQVAHVIEAVLASPMNKMSLSRLPDPAAPQ